MLHQNQESSALTFSAFTEWRPPPRKWPVDIPAPAESFVMLRGEPRIYIKTAESGFERAHGFCGRLRLADLWRARLPIRTSTASGWVAIKQRAELHSPRWQVWCRSALPWAMDLNAVEKHDRQPSFITEKLRK
jgi:hypothetical protein